MINEILQHLPGRLDTGIIVLDQSQKIVLWNEWLERYTGEKADALKGLELPKLYPLFQQEPYQSFFLQTLEHGKSMFCSGALHPLFIPPLQGKSACRQNMQIEPLEAGGKPHILIQIFDITNQHKRVQLLKQEVARRTLAEKTLHYQLKIEQIILQISTAFANLPVEKVDFCINQALKLTGELFDVDRSYVFQISADGQAMSNTHEWCKPGIEPQLAQQQNLSTSVFSWGMKKFKNLETINIEHVSDMPPEAATEQALFQEQGICSILCFPIAAPEKLLGFMGFETVTQERVWAEEHISMLIVVSEIISSSLVKQQSVNELRIKSEELDRYFTSSLDLLCIANTDGEFVRLNPEWVKVLGYSLAELEGRSFLDFVHPEDLDDTLAAINVLSSQGEVHSFENRYLGKDGAYRWIEWRSRPQGRMVYAVARDITDRKQAEENLKYQLEFQKLIAAISSAFVNLPAAQLDEGFNYTLQTAGEFFDADRSFLFRFSDDGQSMTNTHEWCAAGIKAQAESIQDFPVDSMTWWKEQIQNHDYVYLPDVSALPEEAKAERTEFQRQEIKSLLCVPLRKDGRVIGFFGFNSVKAKQSWPIEQASFLTIIAEILVNAFEKGTAAQKINNYTMELELKGIELEELYRKLDEELVKARSIHERKFYKSFPEVKGITLAAHYKPAMRMGGDYYNVTRTDNKLVLYLSDVSGHGMEGTILSTFVKEAIDSYISLKPEEVHPETILRHLYRQYCQENFPLDYFVCIFLAVLDLDTLQLSYTGAGFQEPPLVQTGTGERLKLISEGPPISAVIPEKTMNFVTKQLTITPGTTILITTDGLTEQTTGGTQYGSMLADFFYAHASLSPAALIEAINDHFSNFNNNSLQGDDDITFLILQVASA